jgi:Uma2 family endonuclease
MWLGASLMKISPVHKPTLYEQLLQLPEGLIGEIFNGQLRTHPRPGWPHILASSRLGADLEGAYGRGRGGPGGWWILDEPEIHFELDTVVTVPDIAGWRRERLIDPPAGHKIELAPDWVCEIFSPSTKSIDREEKMPLYAARGVPYLWLVDPKAHTLEAYELKGGKWVLLQLFRDDDPVSARPFDSITIRLNELWG